VVPVTTLDKRPIGDGTTGPVTKRFMTRFHEIVQSTGHEIYPKEATVS
jgi:branched-subunit amino acid aminotransferase/4-amino-4-deoxychorismate lyase